MSTQLGISSRSSVPDSAGPFSLDASFLSHIWAFFPVGVVFLHLSIEDFGILKINIFLSRTQASHRTQEGDSPPLGELLHGEAPAQSRLPRR